MADEVRRAGEQVSGKAGGKERVLAAEIMADAERQAERKVSLARESAEEALQAARAAVAGIESELLAAASARLERERSRLLADIPHEKQVRTLRAKEEVIGRLFEEALGELRSRPGAEMLPVLVRFAAGAIGLLEGTGFVLVVSARDAESGGEALVRETAAAVKRGDGRDVTLRVEPALDAGEGGVIVKSETTGQMVDDSLGTRLRRVRAGLRDPIARMLWT